MAVRPFPGCPEIVENQWNRTLWSDDDTPCDLGIHQMEA
jgi:hypothetical protein